MKAYDCRVDLWVDIPSDIGTPRAYHEMAYFNGYVYMVGGINGTDYLNSVRWFDPIRKIWQQVAPMNDKHCYVITAVLEHQIYAMGRFDGHICLVDGCAIYTVKL